VLRSKTLILVGARERGKRGKDRKLSQFISARTRAAAGGALAFEWEMQWENIEEVSHGDAFAEGMRTLPRGEVLRVRGVKKCLSKKD